MLQARRCQLADEPAATTRVSPGQCPVGAPVYYRLPPACQGELLAAAAQVLSEVVRHGYRLGDWLSCLCSGIGLLSPSYMPMRKESQ